MTFLAGAFGLFVLEPIFIVVIAFSYCGKEWGIFSLFYSFFTVALLISSSNKAEEKKTGADNDGCINNLGCAMWVIGYIIILIVLFYYRVIKAF